MDTPNVVRWLAAQAEASGAEIAYQQPFLAAQRTKRGFDLGEPGRPALFDWLGWSRLARGENVWTR